MPGSVLSNPAVTTSPRPSNRPRWTIREWINTTGHATHLCQERCLTKMAN